jgi:hypothetical protein
MRIVMTGVIAGVAIGAAGVGSCIRFICSSRLGSLMRLVG